MDNKSDFIGKHLDKKMKDHGLPYGIAYHNLLSKNEEQAEKEWLKVSNESVIEDELLPNLAKSTENLSEIKDKDEWLKEIRGEDELDRIMKKRICDYDDESGEYFRGDSVIDIAKRYKNSKLEELEKWIEEQKITPEFNNKITEKIKSLK